MSAKGSIAEWKARWSQAQKGLSWGVDWADREAATLFFFSYVFLSSLTSSYSYDLLRLILQDLLCCFSHLTVFSSTLPPPPKTVLKDHWKNKVHWERCIITQGQGEITRQRPNSRNVSNLFFFLWARCRPSWIPSGVLAGANSQERSFCFLGYEVFHHICC